MFVLLGTGEFWLPLMGSINSLPLIIIVITFTGDWSFREASPWLPHVP
uniref:Uncharacterized protein n=1 Tax=Anguilla anguilla TaxID=7936 RepID=A0A0E9VG20_ANGAN